MQAGITYMRKPTQCPQLGRLSFSIVNGIAQHPPSHMQVQEAHTQSYAPTRQCSTQGEAEVLCRTILVGILICYIVAAAIELEKWSNNNLGSSYRVWPSWGWICAIVAGVLWWFVGSLAACESYRHTSCVQHHPLPHTHNQSTCNLGPYRLRPMRWLHLPADKLQVCR